MNRTSGKHPQQASKDTGAGRITMREEKKIHEKY